MIYPYYLVFSLFLVAMAHAGPSPLPDLTKFSTMNILKFVMDMRNEEVAPHDTTIAFLREIKNRTARRDKDVEIYLGKMAHVLVDALTLNTPSKAACSAKDDYEKYVSKLLQWKMNANMVAFINECKERQMRYCDSISHSGSK